MMPNAEKHDSYRDPSPAELHRQAERANRLTVVFAVGVVCIVGLMVYLVGNKMAERQRRVPIIELREIRESYTSYILWERKPPANLDDFAANERAHRWPPNEEMIAQLREGKYIVVWNEWRLVDKERNDIVSPDKAECQAIILAYEKDVPKSGGFVVRFDGTVSKVTADEFQAAMRSSPPIDPTP